MYPSARYMQSQCVIILSLILAAAPVGHTATIQSAIPMFSAAGTYTTAQSVSIRDSLSGATVYGTTKGATPATSSTNYPTTITVSATKTLEAMAVVMGYAKSAVATASHAINLGYPQTATPSLSLASGTYSSPQSVSISDATSGATIYYTTDGSQPTSSSAIYTGPITVSSTESINALALASGYATSALATATYVIRYASPVINSASGFADSAGQLALNGSAQLSGSGILLTGPVQYEAGTAWYATPVNVQAFATDFTFQLSDATADGFTFAIQNNNATIVGASAGNLGYGYIPNSLAVKFDLFNNKGEGADSTGLYTDGTPPIIPANDMSSSGINLHSGDTMLVQLTYDGTTLAMTITDTVTAASYSTSWIVNIPAAVNGNTAYVGFTGGTGGEAANQEILTWTYTPGSVTHGSVVAAPTFSVAPGTYTSTQTVAIMDTTAGTTIHFTTNRSTPTTSSAIYTSPITVSSTETIEAMAVASGYTNSAVATAAYTINPVAHPQTATPLLSLASGTYSSAQSLSISDPISGATIYYTTDGSRPSVSSTTYTGPITVSSTETINVLALAPGYITSAMATASYIINNAHKVELSWDAPGSATDPVAGYNIYRAIGDSSSYQLLNSLIDTETTYMDSTVLSGTSYTYHVKSVNTYGVESVQSNEVSVTIP
jgi:hypothetical protein